MSVHSCMWMWTWRPSRGASGNLWLSQADNKACVFPFRYKGRDPPLKTTVLCLLCPRRPLQVGTEGRVDGGTLERETSVVKIQINTNISFNVFTCL